MDSMPGAMHMTMQMWFDYSTTVTLWFKSWHIEGLALYAVSCVGLYLLCIFHEGLTTFRTNYLAKHVSKAATVEEAALTGTADLATRSSPAFSLEHKLLLSLLYAGNLTVSYLLMLAVMTYNVGYFIVIVAGLATGHFMFFRASGSGSDICHVQPAEM